MSTAAMETTGSTTAIQLTESGKPMSLAPRNMTEALEFSKLVANSDLAPKDYKGKPGNVLIAIQMGAEVGLAPMQALQNIAVINGRPSLWGDAALAVVMAHPHYESHTETIEGTGDTRTGVFRIKRKGHQEHEARFSVADAKKAVLWGKAGPWTQYPDRMLQLRARGFAIRDKFPDALRGLITTEEAMDYPAQEARPAYSQQQHATATPVNDSDAVEAAHCADCKKAIADYTLESGTVMTAQQVRDYSRKRYSADLCGSCMIARKNKPAAPAAQDAETFVATTCEKIPDDSAIEVKGLLRKVGLSPDGKRLIVTFDDDKEIYSFHKGTTRKFLESKAIGKTCVFFCDESKYGLEFKNVVSIDGVDASTVEFGISDEDMPA